MAEYIYYRPEWTCGRYNKEANVAIYYNLIEGMSYFFEDDSAEIIGWLLNIPRNSCFSVNILSEETDTAIECLIPFLAELVSCGLLTTAKITQKDIKNYRQTLSHDKCSKSQTEVKTTKDKLPIAVSSAEREYMNRITGVASVMFELTYNCSEKCIQ